MNAGLAAEPWIGRLRKGCGWPVFAGTKVRRQIEPIMPKPAFSLIASICRHEFDGRKPTKSWRSGSDKFSSFR